ncbi:hypothetical protein ABIQ69_16920 [Agromyces sp. G08B096]|uniref:DUF4398 domain-containing protein n=1 Tax=Agromyces sp. G08B096 TaxID=3156399 RepID=A0AAU7W727_9MICO
MGLRIGHGARSARWPGRRRITTALVMGACALVLAGCAPLSQTMTDAAAQGRSAVETASLALELEQHGRALFGVSATAFDDAERELSDAARTVSEADVATDEERTLRAETRDAIRAGLDAVDAARESMQGLVDADAAADALEAASARLNALVQAGEG